MPDSGHVVVAPDKFKGTLTAPQVAAHVAAGLRRACPDVPVITLPVADGGDGTVDSAVAGGFSRISAVVRGPTGEPVSASFAVRDRVAILEAAAGVRAAPPAWRYSRAADRDQPWRGRAHHGGHPGRCPPDRARPRRRRLHRRRRRARAGARRTTARPRRRCHCRRAAARCARWTGWTSPACGRHRCAQRRATGAASTAAPAEMIVACDVDNPLLGPQRRGGCVRPAEGRHARRGGHSRGGARPLGGRRRADARPQVPRSAGLGRGRRAGFRRARVPRRQHAPGDRRTA